MAKSKSSSRKSSAAKPAARGARSTKGASVSNQATGTGGVSDETMTVPKDIGEAGMAQKYPSTAPTPVEEAMKLDAELEDAIGGKLTLTQRVDRLEQAVTTGHNIDLTQFAPRNA